MGKLFTFKSKMSDEVTVSVGKTLGWSDLLSFSKDKALENSAFWICLMNLARTFGSLPIHAYSKNNDGSRKIDTTSPEAILIRLLCPYMNPYAFRFCMSINFELYGVAYAKIVRSSLGKPIALHPIASTLVVPMVTDGKLSYQYTPSGECIPKADMLVILNLTANGILPLSPLEYVKKDLAVADTIQMMARRLTGVAGGVDQPDDGGRWDRATGDGCPLRPCQVFAARLPEECGPMNALRIDIDKEMGERIKRLGGSLPAILDFSASEAADDLAS